MALIPLPGGGYLEVDPFTAGPAVSRAAQPGTSIFSQRPAQQQAGQARGELSPQAQGIAANQELYNEAIRQQLMQQLYPQPVFDPTIGQLLSGGTVNLGGGPYAAPGGPPAQVPGIEVEQREGVPTFITQPPKPGEQPVPRPFKPDLKLSELRAITQNIQNLDPQTQARIMERLTGVAEPTVEVGGAPEREGVPAVAPKKFRLSELKYLTAQTQGLPQDAQNEIVGKYLGIDFTDRAMQQKIKALTLQAQKELQVDEVKRGREDEQKLNRPLGAESRLWLMPDGQPVPTSWTTAQAIGANAVPVGEAQLQGTTSSLAARQQIKIYANLIDSVGFPKLSEAGKRGDINWTDLTNITANAARLYARSFQGDPEVRSLLAMYGMIANIARGTGDTANIAVTEREMLKQSLVTFWDSRNSAYKVINQANKVIEEVLKARGFPVQEIEFQPAEYMVNGRVIQVPREVRINQTPAARSQAEDASVESLLRRHTR